MPNLTQKLLLLPSFLLASPFSMAASPTLGVGTPADSYLSTPAGVTPRFGTLINFDTLTPSTALPPGQYSSRGVTSISSPDGLSVVPYSTQSGPNEIFDGASGGTANITIRLAQGAGTIGLGIADSDPVTVTLQALSSSGNPFGSAFSVNLSNTGDPNNPGNGYYYISDTSYDIYGLLLTQSASSSSYSGLAIDDLQFTSAPEPASTALFLVGGALLAFGMRRKQI